MRHAVIPREQRIAFGEVDVLSSGGRVPVSRFAVISAMAAMVLLPIEAGHAGWLSDIFKGKKSDKPPKHSVTPKQAAAPSRVTPAKPRAEKLAVAKRAAPNPSGSKSVVTRCDPPKFRIVVDVGHTAESEGAISARNTAEFVYNLRLAKVIEQKLKAGGFAETRLLVTGGKARRSLVRRVDTANNWPANLFLSIHHDSVPDKLLENWEFEGKKSHFSDRFSGYSVFVSRANADFGTSLAFAELLAREMKAQGLQYARQFTLPIMGKNQHPLLNKETGVYSYDKLIVLKSTRMAAVLLEAGSIINRDEELRMDSAERRNVIGSGVTTAVREFCDSRWTILGPL
jgi:N-acetylmuramoyl-L-alanine amidase